MKLLITSLVAAFAIHANAETKPLAEMIEKASHDIMKLVRQEKLPAVVAEKLHLLNVTQSDEGYTVAAVLDHNEDHSKPAARLLFKYNNDGERTEYTYYDGYINPNATPFVEASTARLFDYAAEALLESKVKELNEFAERAKFFHLSYDAEKKAAVFEVVAINSQTLILTLSLKGELIDYKFE